MTQFKYRLQCFPTNFRQYCKGKKSCAMLSLYSWDNIAQEKPYAMLSETLQTILHKKNPVQCCLNKIWSLFDNFYFEPINFLIITGCRKCRTNIVQISLTSHEKNPGPTLNKKRRLYGTLV